MVIYRERWDVIILNEWATVECLGKVERNEEQKQRKTDRRRKVSLPRTCRNGTERSGAIKERIVYQSLFKFFFLFPSPQTSSVARVLQRATRPFHVVAWKSSSAGWETVSLHNNVSKKKSHAHNNFQKSQSWWNMRETGPPLLKKNGLSRPISLKLTCHSKMCDWRVTNTAPCQRYCLSREWSRKRTASLRTIVIWTYLCRFMSRCVRNVLWCTNGFDLWWIPTVNRGVWRSLHARCEMNKRPENVKRSGVKSSEL